jgi:hypothetical protein
VEVLSVVLCRGFSCEEYAAVADSPFAEGGLWRVQEKTV